MAVVRNRYGFLLNAAVFLVLEIAAVIMLSRTSSLQNIWINRATHRVHAGLWGSGERIRNYFTLDKQNRTLAAENLELSSLVREFSQRDISYRENCLYDSRLGNFRLIPASIVKASRNSRHNYIVLNKGTADGVRPQSGIVTTAGVIGIVTAAGERFCYGITLMNPRMSVSARIGRTGIVAPMEWDGRSSSGALLRGLPLHYRIEPGDTVWTSGFSSVFPTDIPLGVTGGVRQVDGSTNEVAVTLFQDFAALRYVIITDNLDREEIAELEKEAEK